MTPAAALAEAADYLRRSTTDACHAVADALADFAAGRVDSIDAALGIAGKPGKRRHSTEVTTDQRNALICEVRAAHYAHLDPTNAAAEIASMIDRYETTAGRRELHLERCPTRHAGRPQAFAWHLLRLGIRIPGKRRIFDIITAKPLETDENPMQ